MKNYYYILVIILSGLSSNLLGQGSQVQFSQYYSASLHLNPAIAGVYLNPSFHASYRRQVSGLEVGFINDLSQASVILPVKKKRRFGMPDGGIGILVYNQSTGFEGGLNTTGIQVNYAHNIQVGHVRGKETVILSLQGGFEQRSISLSGLRAGSQFNKFLESGFDPSVAVGFLNNFADSPGYPILNFGALYYWNIERNFHLYRYSAFSGFTVNNINRPSSDFISLGNESTALDVLLRYHGGFEFRFKNFDFLPTILGTYVNKSTRFNAGGTIAYDLNRDSKRFVSSNTGAKIALGLWYRLKDSFIFYGGFRSANLNVGISYDLNSNGILGDSDFIDFGAATEISIQYFMNKKSKKGRRSSNPLF